MRKTLNECENLFPDRSYKNSAGNGIIKTEAKSSNKPKIIHLHDETVSSEIKKGESFIKALLTFRWTIKGGIIVVTRQKDTTDESFVLTTNLKKQMQKDLLENNRFVGDFNGFINWINAQIELLKENGFHELKD